MKAFMLRKFFVLEEKMAGINIKRSFRFRQKSKNIIPEDCIINVKAVLPERKTEIEKVIYCSKN